MAVLIFCPLPDKQSHTAVANSAFIVLQMKTNLLKRAEIEMFSYKS
jgi:hypothetical protein